LITKNIVNYILDGLAVLEEYDGSGSELVSCVPGISTTKGGQTYYYHYDRLGSVRFMSDEAGEVVGEYVYDGWGNLVSSSGSLFQPYEFVGREGYYREGELYLLGQRWYDSSAGRFISRDIISNLNLYVYVKNNPLKYIDPLGLQGTLIRGKIWGNWCGADWSAGHFGSPTKEEWKNVGGIDILDEICKKHDACFQGIDPVSGEPLCPEKRKTRAECNKEACEEIKRIDLNELEQPPGEINNVYRAYQFLYNYFCFGSKMIPGQ